MADDDLLARLDAELSRPWLTDLRTDALIRQARYVADASQQIRVLDGSGVVGELLDLVTALCDRIERISADSGTAAGPVGSGEEARASGHESRTAGQQLGAEHQPSSPARQRISADSTNGDDRG